MDALRRVGLHSKRKYPNFWDVRPAKSVAVVEPWVMPTGFLFSQLQTSFRE